MKGLKLQSNKRALVIVAHPDDETIWMGGTIFKYPKVHWTIFSLCRAEDKDRAPKFFRVCKFYKAKGIMANLEDEGIMDIKESVGVIKKLIRKKITSIRQRSGQEKFDYIFTHGYNGEYGHARHIGVHSAVKQMIKKKRLQVKEAVFYFNYKKISPYKLAPKTNSDLTIKLNNKEFSKKLSAMTKIYGFDKDGIDAGYCTNPEAFKILNPKL